MKMKPSYDLEQYRERIPVLEGGLERGLEIYGTTCVEQKTATTAFVCADNSAGTENRSAGSDNSAAGVEKRLLEGGIHAAARGRVIRLAPHYFNTIEDIDAGLDALADLLGSR